VILFASCDLDNYDGPNASISGGIYDVETNELVRQDIIEGAEIEYIEHGFTNPSTQYQIIKNDGTYQNNLMFAGAYTMHLRRGNFVPLDEFETEIKKGQNTIDFQVLPYIRVKNASICLEESNGKVVAQFNIQQTVTNTVSKIGLYAHQDPTVGYLSKTASVEQSINAVTNESTIYTLEIPVSGNFTAGKSYYFIVGALIDASEAKPNYAAPVRIAF
jgi:hypothetical protein